MGGNGKFHRWKISFHRSSTTTSSSSAKKDPPRELLCPILGSLMHDPVVVTSGQTFERAAVQVCNDLGFVPALPDGSSPDFSSVIPNLALKTTICNWCAQNHTDPPQALDYRSVESKICSMWPTARREARDSETELLKGVAEKPDVNFPHAATELNPRNNFYDNSSSSEESVIANASPSLLPFATRPSCYSSCSSSSPPSTSFDAISGKDNNLIQSSDEVYVRKLTSDDVVEQEQGVILLRKTTRSDEEKRISLCSLRLLSALKPLMASKYAQIQTNAVAAVVNLSLAKENKVNIVRSGVVPILIDALKGGYEESQEHAAGAIFSLALVDDNKTAIGVLGALQPLLHALRTGGERTRLRHDAALALYHLSLVQSNREKLMRLGAVNVLLGMLRGRDLVGRVVLVVCNLAVCAEGKSVLLDAGAVECLVGMLREGGGELDSESTRENCVAALYTLSQGSLRFKALAKEVRAAEVLQAVVERGSERAREKAKRMLVVLRERNDDDEDEEVDWEGVLDGKLSLTRYRLARHSHGPNSTEF